MVEDFTKRGQPRFLSLINHRQSR